MIDATSVALTPMFFRYWIWIGDMLRSQHSDMSRSRSVSGALPGQDRNRLVFDVDQDADAIALVESAGDLRNVGGGIAVAEIGLQMRLAPLRENLAVALVVEPVDHDAVVAGEFLEDARGFFAQHAQRRCRDDCLQGLADRLRRVDRRRTALEFDDESAVRRAMKQDVIFDRWLRCAAADRNRNCPQGLLQNRLNALDEIAAKIFESSGR